MECWRHFCPYIARWYCKNFLCQSQCIQYDQANGLQLNCAFVSIYAYTSMVQHLLVGYTRPLSKYAGERMPFSIEQKALHCLSFFLSSQMNCEIPVYSYAKLFGWIDRQIDSRQIGKRKPRGDMLNYGYSLASRRFILTFTFDKALNRLVHRYVRWSRKFLGGQYTSFVYTNNSANLFPPKQMTITFLRNIIEQRYSK